MKIQFLKPKIRALNKLSARPSTNKVSALAYNLKPNSGFTLIETLLVILMFSALAVLMVGVFVSSLELQRRAVNLQQAEDNASFVLESMAKEIRVSQIAGPDTNCPSSPAEMLSMVHPVNGNITYSLSGDEVQRTVNGVDSIISSNTVQFTRFQFCISGAAVNDQKQPRVTIIAGLKSSKYRGKALPQQVITDIQTTVSQRYLSN